MTYCFVFRTDYLRISNEFMMSGTWQLGVCDIRERDHHADHQ